MDAAWKWSSSRKARLKSDKFDYEKCWQNSLIMTNLLDLIENKIVHKNLMTTLTFEAIIFLEIEQINSIACNFPYFHCLNSTTTRLFPISFSILTHKLKGKHTIHSIQTDARSNKQGWESIRVIRFYLFCYSTNGIFSIYCMTSNIDIFIQSFTLCNGNMWFRYQDMYVMELLKSRRITTKIFAVRANKYSGHLPSKGIVMRHLDMCWQQKKEEGKKRKKIKNE